MARTLEWRRNAQTMSADTDFGWFGGPIIASGETITRTLWAGAFSATYNSSAGFPPSAALLKCGLLLDVPGAASLDTPISQPESDWIDLVTLRWGGNISISTAVDWLCLAGFGGPDKDSKAQRRNTAGQPLQLYFSYESLFAHNTLSGFQFAASMSMDVLVRTA